jgi:hypothetical protein
MFSSLKVPIITDLQNLQEDILNFSTLTNFQAKNPLLSEVPFQLILKEKSTSLSSLIDSLECKVASVHLLTIEALSSHRIPNNKSLFQDGNIQLYLPVFSNTSVKFHLDTESLTMQEGDCWYVNTGSLEGISNDGSSDLICLVISCISNYWLEELFFEASTTAKVNYVNQLRYLNTDDSNSLADSIEHSLWFIS